MADVSIRVEGRAGRITLTRPKALNALSHAMVRAIDAALAAWVDDGAVDLVLIDGDGERAFCAGGDIVETWREGRAGNFDGGRRFWADEYRMNARIASFPKPYVALMHGFTMGGGVGVSGHGSHRIVCETTQVAMPECTIGLIPDVGGTHILSRAPGRLGEYLGLTSARMTPGDAIHAGFADAFVPQAAWADLVSDLIRTGDPGVIPVHPAPDSDLAARQSDIDDAFEGVDLASIVARLEASGWGHEVLKGMRRNSPLSMAATLGLVRAARRDPGIEAALRREFRFSWRAAEMGDLLEGIRAQVIDKDRTPTWRDDLDRVRPEDVAAMLAHLGADELKLS